MNNLPASDQLPVDRLAASFQNVTNSYKFFWFLSLLEHIQENGSRVVLVDDLLARMLAWVWYPSCYFKLSFGKQDKMSIAVDLLRQSTDLQPSDKRQQVKTEALAQLSLDSQAGRVIREISRYVPTRFLRPFFMNELRGVYDRHVDPEIQRLASRSFENPAQPCLYRFVSLPQPAIELHELWHTYLFHNLYILNGFCLWHLLNYLQSNNPNVPNLANKLFAPSARDLKLARQFWMLAFSRLAEPRCIYSDIPLNEGEYTLDHFLPWRFVAHDLLWNIVPTPLAVNSSKNDNLPDVTLYYDSFARLQYEAVQAVAGAKANRLLEDYILLYKVESVEALSRIQYTDFRSVLGDTLMPQVQVARNMGFSYGWRYQ